MKRYQCTCLPIHVGGGNSAYFYAAGMLHPRLRTALLPRQLANKKNFVLELTIGRAVPAPELRLLQSPKAVTDYLRVSTDALAPPPAQHQTNSEQTVDQLDQPVISSELLLAIDELE